MWIADFTVRLSARKHHCVWAWTRMLGVWVAEPCHNVPSPLVGEGTVWRAPSQLTMSLRVDLRDVLGPRFRGANGDAADTTAPAAARAWSWPLPWAHPWVRARTAPGARTGR